METRITSATILVNWDTKIHTHALLVFGDNPSQSKNYEEYARKVSSNIWSLDEAVCGFWGKKGRIPNKVYKYFEENPIYTKPKGFENGVKISFSFGVAKVFDTGKGLLTVSLKNVQRENIQCVLEHYVKSVHDYIGKVKENEELQWFDTQLNVKNYKWDIVSLNSTSTLFEQKISLESFYNFCASKNVNAFFDSEYHRGYMQIFFNCVHKKNTVCIYHTGKCVIMGIKSLESLKMVEKDLSEICSEYELFQVQNILFAGL